MCAIVGISKHPEAANLAYLALHALQHRGQEGSGIVSTEGKKPYVHRKLGLVGKVYNSHSLEKLVGHSAIGHNRYSTTGLSNVGNLQPLMMTSHHGWLGLSHNGNLVNAKKIMDRLEKEGSLFQTTNDTEVIIHLLAKSQEKETHLALGAALREVEGAYSLVLMTKKELIAVRDPQGFRPLEMGEIDGALCFASETTAFNLIGAQTVRSLQAGEMVRVSLETGKMIESSFPFERMAPKQCIFEHVYFARPNSVIFGQHVHGVRKALGRKLAEEQPAPDADVVIPVPDSGVPAAIGFAEMSGIPFDMGIIRSHYVGRTFIEPQQSIRNFGVKLKLNAVRSAIEGKSVVVVDDSLVRGTTSKKLIQQLREAGAKAVHFRVSSPPITHSCFYGIDTPNRTELIAANKTLDFTRDYIGADSIGYLSVEGLLAIGNPEDSQGFCDACFTGNYPTELYL